MASVTQKVPNYVLGISTQPDEKKIPGQVVDLVNGVPDVVNQLQKRPGSQLVNTLSPSTAANAKWFSIYTKSDEQYIGQVAADGVVKIWRCSDGEEIPVDYANVAGTNAATYLNNTALSDEKSSDIQVLTINETTFFVNRRKPVYIKSGTGDKSPARLNEAFVSLDTISYGKQYALDFFDPDDNTTYTTTRATGLAVSGGYSFNGNSNGNCYGMGRETVEAHNGGTDLFSTSPPNMSAGGKHRLRYELDVRCNPQIDADHTTSEALDDYHDAYQTFVKLQFGGEGWATNDTHSHTTEKGITQTVKVKSHVNITSRANICAVRQSATSSTADEHVSASQVLSEIKRTLDAISGHNIICTVVGNGLHLYRPTPFGVTTPEKTLMTITTSEANNIADLPRTCRHGYVVRVVNSGEDMDDYYLRFQAEGIAADISKAATYAKSGTTVTVTSTAHGLENDDRVFIDFTSGAAGDGLYTISNSQTNTFDLTGNSHNGTISAGETCTYTPERYGEGVWEEVAAPGIETTLDNTSMPLKLTRANPGTYDTINGGGGTTSYPNGFFQFGYPAWGERDVGDDITNSLPSFISTQDEAGTWTYKYIQKMIFFRNRIALLSEENVILSRVNDFYNFWVKTAMAISNSDPIDLQSSSTFPTKLYDAVETAGGLAIFSASEQFLLSSGAEALLTPETAKIAYLSSYSFNPDTVPVSLGTTIGFLNSTARQARFYEMGNIAAKTEPEVQEQTKIVGELFPQKITNVSASTENDILLFGVDSTLPSHTATNEVWGYKFFESGGKRSQSAWFRWTMPNNVIYQTILDDVYYAVLNTGSTFTLEKFDIKLTSDTPMIGSAPDENRVHLDTKKKIASGDITYDGQEDISTFTLPAGYYSTKTLTVYCTTDSDAAGKSYDIPTQHLDKTFAASAVDASAETITIASHTLITGNPVTYQEGSSAVGGLTDNTVYYVIKVDDNTIKLATSRTNANAGTAINLTSQGGGTHTLETPTVTLPGNWKTSTKDGASVNTDLIVGYEYEFEVELPKLYITQSDGQSQTSETRGSLTIHRMNFDFGDVGVIDVTLKRRGRDDYTYTVESLEWDNVLSSTPTIARGYLHTIPVYDRNENLTVLIKSNHPSPATIHSMNWEGDFSPRYYQRV